MGMVRINGAMTISAGGMQPLLVGVAMRQALSLTGRMQAAISECARQSDPSWRAALTRGAAA